MTEKLKKHGDITEDEAAHIFILAVVIHAYEMGSLPENRYHSSFRNRFDFAEVSEALGEWYDEVLSRISIYDPPDEFHNFITSIPSEHICPLTRFTPGLTSHMIRIMNTMWGRQKHSLGKTFRTSDTLLTNNKMADWVKPRVPLSFDVICHYEFGYSGTDLARFGIFGLLSTRSSVSGLPTFYEREIEEERLRELSKIDIPFLRSPDTIRRAMSHDIYSVACPIEYKDVLDAVADYRPIPEIPKETPVDHVPKDIAYINKLTAQLPFQDITLEEADNLYLLLKAYQALKAVSMKGDKLFRQEAKKAAEPGLNALLSWYKAVEKKLKKGEKGNFVYTLPNDTSDTGMNLYQLRRPIKRSLEKLPKEVQTITTRREDELPVKDVSLDERCVTRTGKSGEYVLYSSSRYGFFDKNGMNFEEWKPVMQCKSYLFDNIYDSSRGNTDVGKLRFVEKAGIKYIVMNENTIAVKEKDLERALEITNLPDSEIVHVAMLLVQKQLGEIRSKIKNADKSSEELDVLLKKEQRLKNVKENDIPLKYITKAVELVYNQQKEKEKYLEENEWTMIDR